MPCYRGLRPYLIIFTTYQDEAASERATRFFYHSRSIAQQPGEKYEEAQMLPFK